MANMIRMEYFDNTENDEFVATVELSGTGDQNHFISTFKAFLVAAGYAEETAAKVVADMTSRGALDFDSSGEDE